jgi:hypothetical protein
MGCLVFRSSFSTYYRCIGDLLLVVAAIELLLLCATWVCTWGILSYMYADHVVYVKFCRPGETSVRCCCVAVSFSWLSSCVVVEYVTAFLDAVVLYTVVCKYVAWPCIALCYSVVCVRMFLRAALWW